MAMKKRLKKQGPGVPEWVVTFGDLMSLLLTFFILLQMFSELKRDHEYQRVITAIKEAFGYSGGVGVMPTDDPPLKSIIEQMEVLVLKDFEHTNVSQSNSEGLDGPKMRVTTLRDDIIFTIGGPAGFEEGSAEVRNGVRKELEKLAVMLRGRRNKIVIRGHATAKYLPEGSEFENLDELCYYRAHNVMGVLEEFGIEDAVMRVEAVGSREPVNARATNPVDAAVNRRVEIIMSPILVDELHADAHYTDPSLARGD